MKISFLKKREFLLLSSFFLFSVAQPDLSVVACTLCSAIGFALFWKGILSVESRTGRFWLSFFWFAGGSFIHLYWMTANRYGGGYFVLVPLGIVFFLGLFFGLFSLLIAKRLTLLSILALSGLWTIGEWSRLFFLTGYTWDPLGLMLSSTLWGMQWVSLFGLFGLTFWVLFTNLLGLRAMASPRKIPSFALWMVAALLPYLFGGLIVGYHHHEMEKKKSSSLSILLVQTALLPEEKEPFDPSVNVISPLDQWKRILSFLKDYKKEKIDLIVFSESAVPYGTDWPIYPLHEVKEIFEECSLSFPLADFTEERASNAVLARALADLFSADIIIGLDDYEEKKAYNAALLFRPKSQERWRYEKRILLPMAEYIPFSLCRKFLATYYGIVDSFTPGQETKIFPCKVPVGLSICSEETYSSLLREAKQKGAELFVNLTNDAWYPRSRLPSVHYYHGRLRAVEEGVPLVRACNTGVSCAVNSLGEQVASLCFEEKGQCPPGILHIHLPAYCYSTLYSKVGNQGIIISSCSFLLLFITNRFPSLRKMLRLS